jgi:transcriptional regulator with XRE-family HTH domain
MAESSPNHKMLWSARNPDRYILWNCRFRSSTVPPCSGTVTTTLVHLRARLLNTPLRVIRRADAIPPHRPAGYPSYRTRVLFASPGNCRISAGWHPASVDDIRFGTVVRVARLRRAWRQQDLADRAGVSRSTVSRIERGLVQELSIGQLRAVCQVLEIRVELLPKSRLAELERIVAARHAALGEHVVTWIGGMHGWIVRPEVSFAFYGDRGVVDVVAWHAAASAILVIELKTEIIDVAELLGTLDRKRRVASQIAEMFGWHPRSIGTCLLVGESMPNRRRVAEHSGTFRSALPADGRALRAWLRAPGGELRAMRFVSDARPGTVRSAFAAPRRVSTRFRGRRGNQSSCSRAS